MLSQFDIEEFVWPGTKSNSCLIAAEERQDRPKALSLGPAPAGKP